MLSTIILLVLFSPPRSGSALLATTKCATTPTVLFADGKKHKDVVADVPPREGWVIATRALRGEYDPDDPDTDNEQASLLPALIDGYPAVYSFKAVGKLDGEISADDFVDQLVEIVTDYVEDVVETRWTPRLNGKFASVQIDCLVESPQVVQDVFERLNAVDRVTMSF